MRPQIKNTIIATSILTIILLGLRILNLITWSYWWVTSPLWGIAVLALVITILLIANDKEVMMYIRDTFSSWYLIRLLSLAFTVQFLVFWGLFWTMGHTYIGIAVGTIMGLFFCTMLIIARYLSLKTSKKNAQ